MSVPPESLSSNALVPRASAESLSVNLAPILRSFLAGTAYEPPTATGTNEQLVAAMHAKMEARAIASSQLERLLRVSADFVELSYPYYEFKEKKIVALYHWYMVYLDGLVSTDAEPLLAFQERFLRRQPQLDPVLDALAAVFIQLYDIFEPCCANLIVASSLEFFTGTALEPQIKALTLDRTAKQFPWYLRELTGIAEGFSHLVFPMRLGINVLEYIKAIPEMCRWLNVSNDLLSFYKELAGETVTYVCLRALVENKDAIQVLTEVKDELLSSQEVIHATLAACPAALRTWKSFEQGYIFWHLSQDRYKLRDLDL